MAPAGEDVAVDLGEVAEMAATGPAIGGPATHLPHLRLGGRARALARAAPGAPGGSPDAGAGSGR